MIETPLYTDIQMEYPKEKIHGWPFHQITENCRLHYKLIDHGYDENTSGFYFCSINTTGYTTYDGKIDKKYPDNQWENETTTAEILLQGCAYFDGLRHLYFGTEETKNDGYFYYPDMDTILLIMNKLVEMEKQYCGHADERKLFGSREGTDNG